MKKFLLTIALAIATLNFTGCGTIKQAQSLPPDQRAAFLQAQAREFLAKDSTKQNFKSALVFAGMEIMDWKLTPEDKAAIGAQMKLWSPVFRGLATGQIVTAKQLEDALKASAVNSKSGSVAKFSAAASLAWSSIFDQIKIGDDPQLVIDYLILSSEAAQEIGEAFTLQTI